MKGGTALNLFVQDMPRLSVPIDVVFVAHKTGRENAFAEIAAELAAIQRRFISRGIGAEVVSSKTGDETKINQRLLAAPAGAVLALAWLKAQGISRKLANYYVSASPSRCGARGRGRAGCCGRARDWSLPSR